MTTPTQEVLRLAALNGYDLLDTPADPELDAIVRIAAAIAGVPTATVNLIDAHRQCQLSAVGFDGTASDRSESMCARNLGNPAVVHVPDARTDPRYNGSAWVDGRMADVVFYASAPLITADGHHLGSLCVFDGTRHELCDDQIARLADLADVVMALLERRKQNRLTERLVAEVREQRELAQLTLTELVAREEFTSALLDSVDVAVVACDAEGYLTVFNPTARRMHGLEADPRMPSAEHARAYSLFHADGSTPLAAEEVPLRRALRGETVRGVEMVIAPEGIHAVRVVCTGRALHDETGRVIGAVVAMQDITADRAHIDALVQATTELRRSNEELANLAAVASHDLAAPLTAVVGYLELVLDVHADTLGDEGTAWIGTALRAAQRMQGLIEAVLEHARADSTGLAVRAVNVRDVLSHVVEDLGAAAHDAQIGYVAVGGRADNVQADPVLLRQLLQNLVGNSVRYRRTDRPCHIEVRVRDTPDGGWDLAVLDNGRGIPAQERESVFGMFATSDDAATGEPGARRPGYGIGLATCLRIVQRHGGRISAGETPGGGATLRATFPPSPTARSTPAGGQTGPVGARELRN